MTTVANEMNAGSKNKRRGQAHRSARKGSILIETIMVLPLYMLLIGLMLWFGEMGLAKQKLAMANRYVAWQAGNRKIYAAAQQNAVDERFFSGNFDYEVTRCAQPVSPGGNATWWHRHEGDTAIRMVCPAWIKGWIMAGNAMTPDVRETISASLESVGDDRPHVVIMRAEGAGESLHNVESEHTQERLNLDWNVIRDEKRP